MPKTPAERMGVWRTEEGGWVGGWAGAEDVFPLISIGGTVSAKLQAPMLAQARSWSHRGHSLGRIEGHHIRSRLRNEKECSTSSGSSPALATTKKPESSKHPREEVVFAMPAFMVTVARSTVALQLRSWCTVRHRTRGRARHSMFQTSFSLRGLYVVAETGYQSAKAGKNRGEMNDRQHLVGLDGEEGNFKN